MITMFDQIDLADYKSAHGAAQKAGEHIRQIAEELDQDPDLEVTVKKEELRDGFRWVVSWPGGPFNWAVMVTGGEAIHADEIPEVRGGANEPELTGFFGHDHWQVEAGSGTKLEFYPR